MSAQINAQAGAVVVNGLAGDLHVATLAGSVEGRGLSSAEVSVRTEAGETTLRSPRPRLWFEPPPGWGRLSFAVPEARSMRLTSRQQSETAASMSINTTHLPSPAGYPPCNDVSPSRLLNFPAPGEAPNARPYVADGSGVSFG
jgi:hypothetical protein